MDGIANVARQQQSQVSSQETQGRAVEQAVQTQTQQNDLVKQAQDNVTSNSQNKITSEQQVRDLVSDLNKALEPLNTNLKFGVDSQDIFYVSVIESQTNKMIRRFPAEKAQDFLPKMQEVSGVLFDSKG
jgi:flagellar protein FlaG